MIGTESLVTKSEEQARVSKRDWIILPMIALFTALTLLGIGEAATRVLWREAKDDPCYVFDKARGRHFLANCKSTVKTAEGPWVHNFYNECGYRTAESCGPKPSGSIRVAVLGSSYSFGYLTPYEDAYTTRAAKTLAGHCKKHVEFQNLGVPGISLVDIYHRTDEALALKPDILLLSLNPLEFMKVVTQEDLARRNDPHPEYRDPKKAIPTGSWFRNSVWIPLRNSSRLYLIGLHFVYQDPERFIKLDLARGDEAGYLRQPFTDKWEERFRNLDTILADIDKKSRAASVPVVIMIGPSPSQVALGNSTAFPNVSGSAFSAKVSQIAAKYGIHVVDPLPAFVSQPERMTLFFGADGHTGPSGQRLLADAISDYLIASDYSAFKGCSR